MPGRTNVGKTFSLSPSANNAINLNGSGKYGRVTTYANLTAITDWTIEYWINDNGSNAAYAPIMGVDGAGTAFAILAMDSSEGTCNFHVGYSTDYGYIGKTSQQMTTGSWVHMAAVHNSSAKTLTIYKNAVDASSDFSAAGVGTYVALTGLDFYFGTNHSLGAGMSALYGCTRVWSVQRTAAELLANKGYYLDPTQETGLVLNLNLIEGSGTTVANTATSSNNMTLTGTPSWGTGPTLTTKNYNGPRSTAGARSAATRTLIT